MPLGCKLCITMAMPVAIPPVSADSTAWDHPSHPCLSADMGMHRGMLLEHHVLAVTRKHPPDVLGHRCAFCLAWLILSSGGCTVSHQSWLVTKGRVGMEPAV